MPAGNDIVIRYVFSIPNREPVEFTIRLDPKTVEYHPEEPLDETQDLSWIALDFKKCEGCPLTLAKSPVCPIAKNLEEFHEHFGNEMSFTRLEVTVYTALRNYTKEASMQEGLRSIFGLIMATSGCPHMNFLKPMAYFHLPFSNLEETIVRSASFYLLKQFFRSRRGQSADWSLEGFERSYKNVSNINAGIASRIRASGKLKADAQPNAIVMLDCFAQFLESEFVPNFTALESVFLDLE